MVEGSGEWQHLLSSGFQLIAQSKYREQIVLSTFKPTNFGVVAQLVEHLLCKQGVASSNLAGSTKLIHAPNRFLAPISNLGLIAQLVRARA